MKWMYLINTLNDAPNSADALQLCLHRLLHARLGFAIVNRGLLQRICVIDNG